MGVEAIIALLLQLGPQAVQLWFAIEGLLKLGPDEKQNIANALAAAEKADDATKAAAAAWLTANNFQVP